MRILYADNVNDAYYKGLTLIGLNHLLEQSRNGSVWTYPTPVCTVYHNPTQRMLFDKTRNANPFFHLMEAFWMLAGRNDVEFVSEYAANMKNYSDDGETLNGAYGFRWRRHFGVDQLRNVLCLLQSDPNTRRAVLGMYDPNTDQSDDGASKDIPCNTHVYFRIKQGKLHMTVSNRSNDIVWGCYGANAVHMSVLHEFMAQAVGVPVGTYTQFSNDWHIYQQHWDLTKDPVEPPEHLYRDDWTHVDLIQPYERPISFLNECTLFVHNIGMHNFYAGYNSGYLNWVMQPLAKSWNCYKEGAFTKAVAYASTIKDTAVQLACMEWLERREK